MSDDVADVDGEETEDEEFGMKGSVNLEACLSDEEGIVYIKPCYVKVKNLHLGFDEKRSKKRYAKSELKKRNADAVLTVKGEKTKVEKKSAKAISLDMGRYFTRFTLRQCNEHFE